MWLFLCLWPWSGKIRILDKACELRKFSLSDGWRTAVFAWVVSDHARLVIYLRSDRIAFESSHMEAPGTVPQKCFCRLTFSLVSLFNACAHCCRRYMPWLWALQYVKNILLQINIWIEDASSVRCLKQCLDETGTWDKSYLAQFCHNVLFVSRKTQTLWMRLMAWHFYWCFL